MSSRLVICRKFYDEVAAEHAELLAEKQRLAQRMDEVKDEIYGKEFALEMIALDIAKYEKEEEGAD